MNRTGWVDDAATLSVRRQLSAAPAPSGAGELSYLHTDHLGSSSTTTDASGNVTARQSYYPYGGVRQQVGTLPTRRTYTGQYADDTGLMFYNARYYAPALGRFISADTIVPGAGNPQNLNRYMYVIGNPIKYNDPSGHCPWCIATGLAGAVISVGLYSWNVYNSGQNWDIGQATVVGLMGAGAGVLIGTGVGAVAGGTAISAIATSAGVGMAAAEIGYLGWNIATGSDFSTTDFVISSVIGGVTGAVGQAGAVTNVAANVTRSIALNGGANVIQYGAIKAAHGELPTLEGVAWAGGTGMLAGAFSTNTAIDDIGRGSGPTRIGLDLDHPDFKINLQSELLSSMFSGAYRTAFATGAAYSPNPSENLKQFVAQ